jgi:peroxiredoxin
VWSGYSSNYGEKKMRFWNSFAGAFALMLLAASIGAADEASIASDARETKPLRAGDSIPDVAVKNPRGESVKLSSLHQDRPVVLVFFRGGWCPICTRHTQQLIQAYPQVKESGAELVGISPDDAEHSQENVETNSIPFSILSDADVAAAKAFGLAFQVDDATVQRYKGFGIDLEAASGFQHHALPIPAVYIVDKSGKIVFAHSDPNYRQRLDTDRILAELKKLQ